MKHIKLFKTAQSADGQLVDSPCLTTIKNNKNNINFILTGNNSKQYGFFVDESNNVKVNTVPSIPMAYMWYLMMMLYPGSPSFQQDFYNLAINSYAGQYVDYGVIKWPNKEMKFNISDVDNFFNSIDNGVATENNFFIHQVILPANIDQIEHMMSYFNITTEYVSEDTFIKFAQQIYANVMLCLEFGAMHTGAIFAYNIYKDNNQLFNFNSDQSMMFTDNVETIMTICQQAYPWYLPYLKQIYATISSVDTINYFFITTLNQDTYIKFKVAAVIGCIADNDTYFIFVPTELPKNDESIK